MRGFIEDRVEGHHPNDPAFTPRSEIYMAYTVWAALNGFQAQSAQRFYEGFVAACIDTLEYPLREYIKSGVRGFKGITLK